jgi:hypothetical protein
MSVRNIKVELQSHVEWRIKRGLGLIFDVLHGVDTSGGVCPEKLEIASMNSRNGIAYDACPWSTLRRSLRLVSLQPEEFTFVDIGSGKGKVLLSALVLPFKRVVGVEYSPYLSRIAERNIASARFLHRQCKSVQVICSDAVQYAIPDEPAIFFFANPFTYEIMQVILDNIMKSYLNEPRLIFLIFYAASSIMPRVREFLPAKTDGRALRHISTTLRKRSLNIFELSPG